MVHIDTSLFDIRYGVFRFKSMFATFILWVVIGFFGSLINWAYLRIIISPIAILVMNVDTDFSKEEEIDPRKFRFARSKSTPTHIKSPVVKKNFLRTPA